MTQPCLSFDFSCLFLWVSSLAYPKFLGIKRVCFCWGYIVQWTIFQLKGLVFYMKVHNAFLAFPRGSMEHFDKNCLMNYLTTKSCYLFWILYMMKDSSFLLLLSHLKQIYFIYGHLQVSGQLDDHLQSWDALRAALPVGTVSGAPKVKISLLSYVPLIFSVTCFIKITSIWGTYVLGMDHFGSFFVSLEIVSLFLF
jgi:hypothetical protein